MTVRLRTLVIAAVAVLLLAIGTLAFPLLYDPASVKQFLLRQVELQVGRKIQVGEARLEVFPRIRLQLSDVVIRDLETKHVFFTAQRLDLVLRAYSLLRQQVVGKRLLVEHPHLTLRRNQAGQWNVTETAESQDGSVPPTAGTVGDPLALLLKVRESTLVNGRVTILDEFRSDGMRTFDITGLDAHVLVASKGQQAEVEVSGTIPSTLGSGTFAVGGRIAPYESPVKLVLEEGETERPGLTFEGTARALKLDLRQFADFFGPRPVPARIRGTADLQGHIRLAPGLSGYDMLLSNMSATVERLALTGHASLSGLMAAQPTFSFTIASSEVSVDELLTRFPIQWLPAQLQMALIERDIGGTVKVIGATVTGSTAPEPRMSVVGEFLISRAKMLVGEDRTPVQELTARVFLEPDRVRITELSGTYGHMRISAGKAVVSPIDVQPWLELEVKGGMAAADLIATLAKSIKLADVAERFGELTDIKGQALVSLRIAGPIQQDPDGLRIMRAEVTAQDVWFRSKTLPERIVDLNGRFLYSKTGIEFDRLAGRLGRTLFELGGGISFGEPSVYQDFTVRTRGDVTQLLQVVSLELPRDVIWRGMATGALTVSGPLNAPRMRSVVDARETEFTMPEAVHKPVGTSASVEFEGTWGRDEMLAVDRLDFVLPPFRITTKGKVRLAGPFGVDGSIVSGPISVAGLPQGMTVGMFKDGIVEVSLDVKGKGSDWRNWNLNGWVAVTDGLIMPKGAEYPIKDLYLRLKIDRMGAEIKRLAIKIRDSDVRMTGTLRNLVRNPTLALDVESAQMDLDLLIPKGKRSPVRDAIEALAEHARLTATVAIDRGVYRNITITDLSSRVNARDSILDIDRISGQMDGGEIAGRLVVYLPKQKRADIDITYRFSGLEMEKLLLMVGDRSRVVYGTLSASGSFRGHDGDALGFLHSLDGKTDFRIHDGHIQKGKVIPKIITILNLPTLLQGKVDLAKDGLPFDRITGSFSMSNGVFTNDNLIIDSPVMKMSAAGNYDIESDQVNAVVVVSPFGSYSQLLKSIPLFGKIFKGEREGTAIFEVKGSFQNPNVTYLPLRSFAKGMTGLVQLAFDMLKNTIMLPKEMILPTDEAPSRDGVRPGRKSVAPEQPEPRLP